MAAAPVVVAPGEPMDINTAVQVVLKKALAHDGLSRGLHETTRAIEKGQAQVIEGSDHALERVKICFYFLARVDFSWSQ